MSGLEKLYAEQAPYDGDPLADDMGGPPTRVHDWRNHIGDLGSVWKTLPREARMAVAMVAQDAALNEEWE